MAKEWTEDEFQQAKHIISTCDNGTQANEKLQLKLNRTLKAFTNRRKKVEDVEKYGDLVNSVGHKALDVLTELKDLARPLEAKDTTTVHIDEEDYFAILFTGDWHIEHLWSKHVQLAEDLEKIAKLDHVHVVHTGDGADWHMLKTEHQGGAFENMLPPRLANEVLKYLFGLLEDKLIATCAGNHDMWVQNASDFNAIKNIMDNLDVAYLGSMGTVQLKLYNDKVLQLYLAHRLKGHSIYNKLHSLMRAVRMDNIQADILVSAHDHELASGFEVLNDRPYYYFKTGTYLRKSRWSQDRGYHPSAIGMSAWLLVHPDDELYSTGHGIDELVKKMNNLR